MFAKKTEKKNKKVRCSSDQILSLAVQSDQCYRMQSTSESFLVLLGTKNCCYSKAELWPLWVLIIWLEPCTFLTTVHVVGASHLFLSVSLWKDWHFLPRHVPGDLCPVVVGKLFLPLSEIPPEMFSLVLYVILNLCNKNNPQVSNIY